MKKLKMKAVTALTFEAGCNKYPENCRQRTLREGTVASSLKATIVYSLCFEGYRHMSLQLELHI